MNELFRQRKDKMIALQKTLRDKLMDNKKAAPKKPEKPQPQEQLFIRCHSCGAEYTKNEFTKAMCVCKQCGFHHPVTAYHRLGMLLDRGSFRELNRHYNASDPLAFPGYSAKLLLQKKKTSLSEAVVTGVGKIDGRRAVVAVMDSRFLMGSMGVSVGEKITRAVEYATRSRLPLIIFSASGGARMQEGIFSLMQMAKTSAAIAQFSSKGGFYISYLTHPTTGGVSASFASLGDITLAEPGALIGFAGPRVIEQTIGQKLPEGFQRAEYLEEHGFVDAIIERRDMRETVSKLLRLHENKNRGFTIFNG